MTEVALDHGQRHAGVDQAGRAGVAEAVGPAEFTKIEALPLHSRTPLEWGRAVLAEPISLLIDHAFLEKKAATNALELMTRWRMIGSTAGWKPWRVSPGMKPLTWRRSPAF